MDRELSRSVIVRISSPRSRFRIVAATVCPTLARARAVASPIPLLVPVTRAVALSLPPGRLTGPAANPSERNSPAVNSPGGWRRRSDFEPSILLGRHTWDALPRRRFQKESQHLA